MKKTSTTPVTTTKVTKHNLVKAHLLKHKSITSLEAIDKYSATRLSAIIFNLRQSGWDIVTKSLNIKDKYGNNCVYGKYNLVSLPKNRK